MVEHKNIKIVTEDAVLGNGCQQHEKNIRMWV